MHACLVALFVDCYAVPLQVPDEFERSDEYLLRSLFAIDAVPSINDYVEKWRCVQEAPSVQLLISKTYFAMH